MATFRFRALADVLGRKAVEVTPPSAVVSDYYGKHVFNQDSMREFLSDEAYKSVLLAIEQGKKIDRKIADQVAAAMKAWAISHDVTHYCHWFQPLTGRTAEKHDAFFMPVEGGRPRRVSFVHTNYCTSPAWSPKGDKLAFVCRKRGNQLFISNVDGSQAAQVTFSGNNEDPSWSPDGRYLAYSSNFGRGGVRNIAIRSLLGGNPVQISFTKAEDSQPAWSPLVE